MNLEIITQDNTNTLFSTKFQEHYHSIKDGALNESLQKHIVPAFEHHIDKKEIKILDICFGLGYNTLSTIYYIQKNSLDINLKIYSPELDLDLIRGLSTFKYPDSFSNLKDVINKLSSKLSFSSKNLNISIKNENALDYVKKLDGIGIDIVYQDAFSYRVNSELWSEEFFKDIKKTMSNNAILTTYSVARVVKNNLENSGFIIKKYKSEYTRKSLLAFNS
jgi:tRNA U34 5-methylaminomethyl-2-thiouridine-forming methyltransferase MnmC